jgi:cell division protein FtsQ
MDGGGRLTRSLRSLRPDADLKAAARGAAIVLRGGFVAVRAAIQRRRAASRPAAVVVAPQSSNRLIAFVERRVPPQVGAFATALLLVSTISLGVVRGGHVDEVAAMFDEARNALANAAGFRIAIVDISGRQQLTQDEVLASGGITGRSSLLFLDATTVRDRLKANPWIADATVLKFYPGRLQIEITERKAFAVWQRDGRLSVIADDGAVLEAYVARRYAGLPLVVGRGAETRARDFVALLNRYPQIKAQTKASVLVGERRWNLQLADGLTVRLPEHDTGLALASLARLDKDDQLLSRDIDSVDLRLANRVGVRLSENAARAREEAIKAKQPKRKANDA